VDVPCRLQYPARCDDEAAAKAGKSVARISFQGCRQRLLAAARRYSDKDFARMYGELLKDIAADLNPFRPFRIEPRAIKRRKKQYDLLNQPRTVLREKLKKRVA
jgi:hypothetical protein